MTRIRATFVVVCALLVGACGESSEPSSSAAPPAKAVTADRGALVEQANQLCGGAESELERTSARIQAAKTDGETSAAWTEQYGVVADLFKQLRAVAKVGVDKPYDTALARLATVLGIVGQVPDKVGDQAALDETFALMQGHVNAFGDATKAAGLQTCLEVFTADEDERS